MRSSTALVFAATALGALPALAAQRTFVASVGDDLNACTLSAPCRGLAAAMVRTDPKGEIVVLDSAGYGRVTVDRSVTITSPSGVYGGISAFAGTNGIDVVGGGVDVVLRGLTINGQGGTHGVALGSGARIVIESCVIANMGGNGIDASGSGAVITVKDTVIRGNTGHGISVVGAARIGIEGVHSVANGQSGLRLDNGATGSVVRSRFDENVAHGAMARASDGASTTVLSLADTAVEGNGGSGIDATAAASGGGVQIYVNNAILSGNSGHGVSVDAVAGGRALVSIAASVASGNGGGLRAAGGLSAGEVTLAVTASTISRNGGVGLLQSGAAHFQSRRDNAVHDNNNGGPQTAGTISTLTSL